MSQGKRKLSTLFTFVLFFGAVLALIFYSISKQVPALEDEESLTNNIGFFLLINLNIIVVMVLGFLVIKNLVKLVLDRRRNILGSRLRLRLVAAFVGLSLVPAVLLFLVAKGILATVLQGWFSPQISSSVDAAMGVARHHYDAEEAKVYRHVRYLSLRLGELFPYLQDGGELSPEAQAAVKRYLDHKREEYGLLHLAIVDEDGRMLLESAGLEISRGLVTIPRPNLASLRDALEDVLLVVPEQSMNGDFLRGYGPIDVSPLSGLSAHTSGVAAPDGSELPARYAVMATAWILPELNETLGRVISSYDDYRELRTYRRPLASSYVLTLVIFTLMIVFAAILGGVYLARGLTVPIQQLAAGTEEIAQGNLDVRIPEVGDDELAVLVHSFNVMTEDLKRTTGELEARRRYMETVLASVAVGVVSVDREGRITTFNTAAADMLAIEHARNALDRNLREVFPSTLGDKVSEMLNELYASPEKVFASGASLEQGDKAKQLQITVNKLMNEQGIILGAVILLDDLTELVNAQRMAAWREVARRIAHEIKNPLTPIQLSAQRIQRRFSGKQDSDGHRSLDSSDQKVISDCTETIVNQVSTLRNLVNEFSHFARMPKTSPRPVDLNAVIGEVVAIYREASPDVRLVAELDTSLPIIEVDREQMSRVFVNLFDNALASVRAKRADAAATGVNGFIPEIKIDSTFNEGLGLVSIRVSDNGTGIADPDKPRLFEPYFTTKKGGTGLGLAIVSTIIADHNGFVRVRDNANGGASFTIELPVIKQSLLREA